MNLLNSEKEQAFFDQIQKIEFDDIDQKMITSKVLSIWK